MGKYKLAFKKSVAKDLRDIPKKDVARILQCFQEVAENPRGPKCEKLSGRERYRIRQGVYRVIYEIQDDALVVVVVKVDGLVKSPSAALRFNFVVAAHP